MEEINCLFTIKEFEFRSKNAEIVVNNGIEIWRQRVDTFTDSNILDPDDESNQGYGYLMLCKRQKAKLSTSQIYHLSLDIPNEINTGYYEMYCGDLTYEDGILIATKSSYCHALYNEIVMNQEGVVRFRKIK